MSDATPAPLPDRADVRVDPHLGTRVHVVGTRQGRPNLPDGGCPFCVGGLEAPEPYDVSVIPNRWPAMQPDRCEVVLYAPAHDAALWQLGAAGIRRVVDVWAERTEALGSRDDVDYVLCFENRGPDVGATISHPHGQIYAYDHVPERPRRLLDAGWQPDTHCDPRGRDTDDIAPRFVSDHGDWFAYVPDAAVYPIAVTLAPRARVADLASLSPAGRDELSALLADVLRRLDRLFDRPLPYMMWVNQRPTCGDWESAWLNIEIVSPWRAAGVQRFIAAAEVACNEYFNPLAPEAVAESLRSHA